ncbi:hypothetical protein JCM24511_02998 [Saitozyma sp. JCM 24511]|nr:hypothetical protein JCM24511_02998 [Saitozyma sp. JCM 24511]
MSTNTASSPKQASDRAGAVTPPPPFSPPPQAQAMATEQPSPVAPMDQQNPPMRPMQDEHQRPANANPIQAKPSQTAGRRAQGPAYDRVF